MIHELKKIPLTDISGCLRDLANTVTHARSVIVIVTSEDALPEVYEYGRIGHTAESVGHLHAAMRVLEGD